MKVQLSVIFLLLLFSSATFAASIPLRGVVEGFTDGSGLLQNAQMFSGSAIATI